MTKTQYDYNSGFTFISKKELLPEPVFFDIYNMHFDYTGRLMIGNETIKSKILKKIIKIRNALQNIIADDNNDTNT